MKMINDLFDPVNVQNYYGKTFVTENNSRYTITNEGKLSGSPGIEGAEVMMIAGLREEMYREALEFLNVKSKHRLDSLIFDYGEAPYTGLRLVLILMPKVAAEKRKIGVITSFIKRIDW